MGTGLLQRLLAPLRLRQPALHMVMAASRGGNIGGCALLLGHERSEPRSVSLNVLCGSLSCGLGRVHIACAAKWLHRLGLLSLSAAAKLPSAACLITTNFRVAVPLRPG